MSEQIIIDLQNSANAKEFTGNLIHQMEFDTVIEWINSELERKPVSNRERLHEAITVLGTRGSGKTTFLLSILKKYDDSSKVSVLEIIDPTLIEEKGHIFLDIISRIKEKVENKLATSDLNPESSVYLKKKDWQDHIQRLAHGIPLLDGVGGEMTENNWQDAEFIMHNGLTAVRSARQLEENFHKVIEMALEILDKEAFLIIFDDIDIDFRKGWRVMETIRKYFTTPKIVTLISGDLRLYSKAIRKQQWKNFGKALLINEGDRQEKLTQFNEMVTEMEGQYLQKVMKLNRRVNLSPLNEKLPYYKGTYDVIIKGSTASVEIQQYYNNILRNFGISNKMQAEIYRSFLLSLPVRSQIQFLTTFEDGNRMVINNFRITDAFLNDLYEKDVNINLIYSNPKFLNTVILKLLQDANILEEGYQLQPTLQNHTLNACLTALTFLSAQKIRRDPFLIFDYLIKLGYTRNLEAALYTSKETSTSSIPSTKGLIEHSGLLQDKVLRDSVGLMNAYTRGALNSTQAKDDLWGGTILLYTLNSIAKQERSKMLDRIDIVFEGSRRKNIAYIPLSICQSTTKQFSLLVYSFYSLLATIGELLRKNTDIEQGLYEFSQLRSYPMPDFTTGLNSRGDTFSIDERTRDENHYHDDGLHMMEEMIFDWTKQYNEMLISPHLLGKISTRFFYALSNIEQSNTYENLGELFSLQITAFLNAALIEEAKESPEKLFRGINLNNVNTSPRIFLDNLKNITRYELGRHQLKFSHWLFSCPLFLVYLDPKIIEQLQERTNIPNSGLILEFSVFRELCNVSIKRATTSDKQALLPYEDTISRLRADGISFDLFNALPKGSVSKKNRMIKANLQNYFGDKIITTRQLREFRKYLKANKISW